MTAPAPRVPTDPDHFPATGPNSLAPLPHRLAARMIDLLVVGIPVAIVAIAVVEVRDGAIDPESVPWWLLVVQVGLAVVYETVAVALFGTTLGKWALGLRVARYADGRRPDTGRAAQRALLPNVFAAVPLVFVAIGQWVVYASCAFHPLRRGWHDRYAGTLVVRSR